ncbi:MAG: hypothetical protein EON61_17345 [Alphaproteobacteria bacterium]|nr:MAG: hypothetical protein EON61_17345 [Alphaproteobacteria bacterium]
MTRHKHAHTGLVTPQLPQHWLTAALRLAAMLVLNVASTLQMICRRRPVIDTQATPTDLPKAKTDTQPKERKPAAKHSSPTQSAHPEQGSFAARPSKDERDTTGCHPGNAKRYPRPIDPVGQTAKWFPALRYASAGMTTENAQHVRFLNSASPSLRSSRRKSGSRAPRVMLATGLHTQPWIPAFAGMSGELITSSNKNAAA